MIYRTTNWDNKGNGEAMTFTNADEAKLYRQHEMTLRQYKSKYKCEPPSNLFGPACSTIDTYTSSKALEAGEPINTRTWY